MGRSKAQDRLMDDIAEAYPAAYVTDEVYIGDLIEERGYTIKEITRELGYKPHKMFVDIVMRDSDSTVAFEYHGEQHYSTVGNMTKTTADVLMNQKLDQEKSWILNRIGIPLIAVPFDMYIDESVLDSLISDAAQECLDGLTGYVLCEECNKLFPASEIGADGVCKGCVERAQELERSIEEEKRKQQAKQLRQLQAEERRERRKVQRGESERHTRRTKRAPAWKAVAEDDDDYEGMTPEEEAKARQKAEAKRRRKAAAEAWKSSPEYQERKEEEKRRRKEKYNEWKASPEYAAQKAEEKRRRKEQYEKAKRERKQRGY